MSVSYTTESVKHPLVTDDWEENLLPDWEFQEFPEFPEQDSMPVEDLFDEEYLSSLDSIKEMIHNNIVRSYMLSSDGKKYELYYGIEKTKNKLIPFLQVKKNKRSIVKIVLNKGNMKKINKLFKNINNALTDEVRKFEQNQQNAL